VVTQSNACLSYLGRKFSLMGATEADLVRVEQALCQASKDACIDCSPANG
jgi:hypothetical protein